MCRLLLIFSLLLVSCSDERDRSYYRLAHTVPEADHEPFVSVWQVKESPHDDINRVLHLPLRKGFRYNFTVDWGDGTTSEITANDDPDRIHRYSRAGIYSVRIVGLVEAWCGNSLGCTYADLLSVPNLGDVGWKNLRAAFASERELQYLAGGDVAQVSDMNYTFGGALKIEVDIGHWDTSNVKSMRGMFSNAWRANPDVSNWNTAQVTDMSSMFNRAKSATPEVSNWDVSQVTSMCRMFAGAARAQPAVGAWNFPNVSCFSEMFSGAQLTSHHYSQMLNRLVKTSKIRGEDICRAQVCRSVDDPDCPPGEVCFPREVCRAGENLPLDAGDARAFDYAQSARQELLHRGWQINDRGRVRDMSVIGAVVYRFCPY